MDINKQSKIITIQDPRPEWFDKRVNAVLEHATAAELVFNENRPLTVHIIYIPAEGGRV